MITLTKHHGFGNDFLVLLDRDETLGLDRDAGAALARAVCDRHTGVGADGLMILTAPPAGSGAVVSMRLHNADGGVAEISGNGIRCVGQAVVDAGLCAPGEVRIATAHGVRTLDVGKTDGDGVALVAVDMGRARTGSPAVVPAALERIGPYPVLTVDTGNPHIVIERADLARLDLAAYGDAIEQVFRPTGINVEVVHRRAGHPTQIDMRVWERGVGLTQACGSGACATAVAASQWWGSGPGTYAVHQPGGTAEVVVGPGAEPAITLIGPAVHVAAIHYLYPR